jgi:ATP-dependent DNA helicase RecQ
VLLFNHADVKTQEFLIEAGSPSIDLLRALWRALRTDPRRGVDDAALKRALPGAPSDAALASATRFLMRAGYLRERDGVVEALHPSDLADGVAPARLDAQALAARADVERQKLRAMVDYAYASSCRRRFILGYFGDEAAGRMGAAGCASCDACRTVKRPLDGDERERVVAVLSLVQRLDGRFGRVRLAAILTGSDDDERFFEAPGRGVLRRQGQPYVMRLLRNLEGAGLVVTSPGEYPTLALTHAGKKALAGGEIAVAMPSADEGKPRRRSVKPPAVAPDALLDPSLLDRLRAFRREAAAREAVPAYCVLTDRTLDEIARMRPPSLDALGAVRGIGAAKIAKYGTGILEVVAADGAGAGRCP